MISRMRCIHSKTIAYVAQARMLHDGCIARTERRVGLRNGRRMTSGMIVSGLRGGEEVVIDGVFTLKSVVLKGTLEEDE